MTKSKIFFLNFVHDAIHVKDKLEAYSLGITHFLLIFLIPAIDRQITQNAMKQNSIQ